MEKNLDSIKKAFRQDLLGLSPKVNELSEMIWFVFKLGGSAPEGVISSRFPSFKEDLGNLKEMGVLKTIDNFIIFSEGFENRLISKNINEIALVDIYTVLVKNYADQLVKRYNLDALIDPIASVLSVIIDSTAPEQPVFLSTLLRSIKGTLNAEDLGRSKELLEYYLLKHLGLVQLAGSYGINLSDKAVDAIKSTPDLWEAYKARPKGVKVAPRPEVKQEPKPEEKPKE